ncbi:GspE/PulE family protein [bacterium]|nr:GspE/PulE family protein [bacterium]
MGDQAESPANEELKEVPLMSDALSFQTSAVVADLKAFEVSQTLVKMVSSDFVQKYRLLPLKAENGCLWVASSRNLERRLQEDLSLMTGCEIKVLKASEMELNERIAEIYQITVEQLIENLDPTEESALGTGNLHDIEVMANEPTVVNLVNVVISTAIRERASDIHFVPFENKLELRYRVDGLLQEKPPPPRHLQAAIISRIKIMADMNIAERFLPQDGHFQIQHRGARVDLRVGTMPTVHGESVVMRLLEKNQTVPTASELGLDTDRVALLNQLVNKPHGLFLATGPTGSGKTTTLYSILTSVYTPEKKILTIEDPVEYELQGVAQIPVRPSRGFTFATGLRAILRQDPDMVMVGEIRDSETAEIAIRAALTGHQVFSTLHTNDAPGAVTRLVDMGVEPFLISSSVEGVLAQRLVRRLCESCQQVDPGAQEHLINLGLEKTPDAEHTFYHGTGCDACRQMGYKGRVGIFELLAIDAELRDLIVHRGTTGQIKAHASGHMITMRKDAILKAIAARTSLREVIRVASTVEV